MSTKNPTIVSGRTFGETVPAYFLGRPRAVYAARYGRSAAVTPFPEAVTGSAATEAVAA